MINLTKLKKDKAQLEKKLEKLNKKIEELEPPVMGFNYRIGLKVNG